MTKSWIESPETVLGRVWAQIANVQTPRGGHVRLLTLATIGANGGPELRQVVLRRANRAAGEIEIFTDATTPKCGEITLRPQVSVLIWQARDKLQIRLRGKAQIIEGQQTMTDWQEMAPAQRSNYGTVPTPGTPIADAGTYERVPDPARLAILRIRINEIDVVHLTRPHDLRALYQRADGWQGQWLAP